MTEGIRKFYASPASEATRKKISEAVMSRPPVSKEKRERMSKAQILRYKTQPHPKPNLGKHLPPEWCSKISKALQRFYSKNEVWNLGIPRSEMTMICNKVL